MKIFDFNFVQFFWGIKETPLWIGLLSDRLAFEEDREWGRTNPGKGSSDLLWLNTDFTILSQEQCVDIQKKE